MEMMGPIFTSLELRLHLFVFGFFLLTLTHILCFSGNILNVYLVKSIDDGNIKL